MLAEVAMNIELARTLLWRAAWTADRDHERARPLEDMASLFASQMAVRAATTALEVYGARGSLRDNPVVLGKCVATRKDEARRLDDRERRLADAGARHHLFHHAVDLGVGDGTGRTPLPRQDRLVAHQDGGEARRCGAGRGQAHQGRPDRLPAG